MGAVRELWKLVEVPFWMAIAGSIGTLARFGLAGLVQRIGGSKFPWGTLAVNLIGCFLFGVVWSLAEQRIVISDRMRFILLVGFMGAFTTFSTFAYETSVFARDSQWLLAAGNMFAHNVLGIACVFLGLAVSRWW